MKFEDGSKSQFGEKSVMEQNVSIGFTKKELGILIEALKKYTVQKEDLGNVYFELCKKLENVIIELKK